MRLTDWQQVRAHLGAAECMWQDLAGLHLQALPEQPPLTSILWAWRHTNAATTAYRLRLDKEVTYLTSIEVPSDGGARLSAWGNRGEVAAAQEHANRNGFPDPTDLSLRYAVDDRGGLVPIPFYWRPDRSHP